MLKAGLVYIAMTGFWPFSEFCFIFILWYIKNWILLYIEFISTIKYYIEVQTEPSARVYRNNMGDGAASNGTYLLKNLNNISTDWPWNR